MKFISPLPLTFERNFVFFDGPERPEAGINTLKEEACSAFGAELSDLSAQCHEELDPLKGWDSAMLELGMLEPLITDDMSADTRDLLSRVVQDATAAWARMSPADQDRFKEDKALLDEIVGPYLSTLVLE